LNYKIVGVEGSELIVSSIGDIEKQLKDTPHVLRHNSEYKEGGEVPTATSFYFRLSGSNIYYTSG